MDMSVAWLQPEQRGPASDLFSRLWASQEGAKPQPGGRGLRVPDLIDHHVSADHLSPEAAGGHAPPPPLQLSRRPHPPPQQNGTRDRSCTTEFDLHRSELVGRHGGTPWLLPGKTYSTGVDGLHEEIEDFFSYMSPTPEEHYMRGSVYTNIRRVILSLWESAGVFIFGSFETGLYLPTSDIDIVVMGSWEKSLEMLKDALIRADICDPRSIKVLDKAAVPIIKLTDRRTDVKVDISFNMKNGLLSANTIKQYQLEYPQMPKLVIALKQFLLQRELNEVFTGGISSYSLILMTVGFLQDPERQMSPYAVRNLGVLLIEFFELYGLKFNYLKTCIKVKDRGYAPRSEVEEQFAAHSSHNSPLCIEDPHNSTNDIGRSSYNMMKVKDAFKYAYQRLSAAVLSPGSAADPNTQSILGRVIQVTDRVVEYRRSIRARFPLPVHPSPPPMPPPAPYQAGFSGSSHQTGSSGSSHSSVSPLSSGTSDASDQDAECCDAAVSRGTLARDASPAGPVCAAGHACTPGHMCSACSAAARSAPRAGPPVCSAAATHGAGTGRGSYQGSGRRPGQGYSSGGQQQRQPRRGQNGSRRKTGGNGSSSHSDSSAVSPASGGGGGQGGGRTTSTSRGQPAGRGGSSRDS